MIFSENRLPRFKAMPAIDMIAPTARGCKRAFRRGRHFKQILRPGAAVPVVTGSLEESQ
jgi:hypothetical protein